MRLNLRNLSALVVLACWIVWPRAVDVSLAAEPAGSGDSPLVLEGPELLLPASSAADDATDDGAEPAEQPVATVARRIEAAQQGPVEEPSGEADEPARDVSEEQTDTAPGAEGSELQEQTPAVVIEPAPKPTLTPEMSALRDRVRRTLAQHARQPFNTQTNTPADLIQFCLAFGCDTAIRHGSSRGKQINGIGALSWNYPLAGYRIFAAGDGRVVARVGYGLQQYPGQLLAMLAQSKVNPDYEIRVDQQQATVGHLVEQEKLNCRASADHSLKLVGLTHYLAEEATWQNDQGEAWSVERLIEEELARSVDASTSQSVRRLMGLSHALRWQERQGRAPEGQFRRASDFVTEYQQYALKAQNQNGSWHPNFFASKGTSNDAMGLLRSTGHILEWLAFSLPEDRLQDPQLVKSVVYVDAQLSSSRFRGNVTAMSPRDIGTLMHALHAMAIYDHRVFKPADPDVPQEGEQVARVAGMR